MLRLVLAVILFAACTYTGCAMAARFDNRVRALKDFQNALAELRVRIIYRTEPLTEALAATDGPCSAFLAELAQQMQNSGGERLQTLWLQAAQEKPEAFSCMTQDDKRSLSEFAQLLGTSDREGQKAVFLAAEEGLNRQISAAEEIRKRERKLYRTLGWLSGAAAAIMIL